MNGQSQPSPARLIARNPAHYFSFGFGSGLIPWAPGTMGTLAAMPIFLILQRLDNLWYIAVVAALFVAGIGLCGLTAKAMGVPDHSAIVWDEIVGYLVTMTALPTGWLWMVVGFILFRILDIIKPWPICWVDRQIHGGLGIMLDDLLAGLIACVMMHVGLSLWVA